MSIPRRFSTAIALAAASVATPADAQPPPELRPADEVAGAPRPEDAGGIIVERAPRPRRTVLRAALFVPRVAARVALAPVRLAYWTDDRYHVARRVEDALWNDARTIGADPVASWDGGRSLSVGFAFVDRELGGAELTARATTGTNDRIVLEPTLSTRTLLGPVRLELGGRYREVLAASFYGYGNGDEVTAPPMAPPGALIDPLASDVAYDSRFHLTEAMVRVSARWRTTRWLSLKAGGSLRQVTFAAPRALFGGDPVGLADVYDAARVPGFMDGVEAARGEVALNVHRRRVREPTQSWAVPSRGAAAELYAGWQQGLGVGAHGFGYGGIDMIGHVDLYGGDRVLTARVLVDTVAGDLDEIPFISLPTLGGDTLRGYWSNRFRDRWSAAASLEYTWPVTEGLAAYAFADAGRVARTAAELVDDPIRAGAGLGLQVHGKRALGARMWLAVSREGAIVANLKLDTSFASRPREVPR